MSIFEEHLGGLHESFGDPGTKECMQEVRRRTEASWKAYMSKEVQYLPCHLMPYPFQVSLPPLQVSVSLPYLSQKQILK